MFFDEKPDPAPGCAGSTALRGLVEAFIGIVFFSDRCLPYRRHAAASACKTHAPLSRVRSWIRDCGSARVRLSFDVRCGIDRQGWAARCDRSSLNQGVAFGAALTMMLVFTWRVFRPNSTLAKHGFVGADTHMGAWRLLISIFGGIGQAWTAYEAFCTYSAMRRRVGLGLAEPIVCNRFLLFGLVGPCMLGAHAALLVSMVFYSGPIDTPGFIGAMSTFVSVQAACLVLAFMPLAVTRSGSQPPRRRRVRLGEKAATNTQFRLNPP